MRMWFAAFIFMCMIVPARAGEAELFDQNQPFEQAVTSSVLRSLLNQALDALEDHLIITGSINPEDVTGDRRGNLEFKFYPEGKSNSDQPLTAEGWFRLSPDNHLRELQFRFKLPDDSFTTSSQKFQNVL